MSSNKTAVHKSPLMTPQEVSDYFRGAVKTSTLEKWRCIGDGPDYIKIGNKPFYTLDAITEYIESNTKVMAG